MEQAAYNNVDTGFWLCWVGTGRVQWRWQRVLIMLISFVKGACKNSSVLVLAISVISFNISGLYGNLKQNTSLTPFPAVKLSRIIVGEFIKDGMQKYYSFLKRKVLFLR